jgi:MFS family permease
MPEESSNGSRRYGSRWRMAAWGTAAALILLPLLAMRVTDEVDWDASDFAFAVGLVIGVGGTYELAARMTGSRVYRAAVAVALAAAFVLIWMNLAVGIIGSEDNPANLMYGGVLAVGLVGTAIARAQPLGMSRALVATALAQALVFVIALIAGLGFTGPITVFFAALWLMSAWLFQRAARERSSGGAAP